MIQHIRVHGYRRRANRNVNVGAADAGSFITISRVAPRRAYLTRPGGAVRVDGSVDTITGARPISPGVPGRVRSGRDKDDGATSRNELFVRVWNEKKKPPINNDDCPTTKPDVRVNVKLPIS